MEQSPPPPPPIGTWGRSIHRQILCRPGHAFGTLCDLRHQPLHQLPVEGPVNAVGADEFDVEVVDVIRSVRGVLLLGL